MYELRDVTPRVQALRERYRDAVPALDAERVRILTDYYRANPNEQQVLKRAHALAEILAKMTIRVEPDELIVGNVAQNFRGCNLWPEWGGIGWLIAELDSGDYDKKTPAESKMTLSDADREYLHSVDGFWREHCIGAKVDAAMPPEIHTLANAGILSYGPWGNAFVPSGHFNANYRKVVEKGFAAIKSEALAKLEQLRGRLRGNDAEKYFFYEAVVISCDAVMAFSKRYAAECRVQAQKAPNNTRRDELLYMAELLDWIMENPARTYHEALQVCFFYHLILSIEGSYLGLTIGRVDAHVGDYLHRDLEAGRLTLDQAQEMMDCFFLKMADLFVSGPMMFLRVVGAYSNNHRITIAGRKPDGSDATNEATYLCLQSAARLQLHDPNLSLALHEDSPLDLWEAGIETAKRVGGVPTLDNADLVASLLHNRGLSWEDARNFCVVGCVEYSGSGCEYANASGPFSKSFLNLNNVLLPPSTTASTRRTAKRAGCRPAISTRWRASTTSRTPSRRSSNTSWTGISPSTTSASMWASGRCPFRSRRRPWTAAWRAGATSRWAVPNTTPRAAPPWAWARWPTASPPSSTWSTTRNSAPAGSFTTPSWPTGKATNCFVSAS